MNNTMSVASIQDKIKKHYAAMGYSTNPLTITVGLMEEAGEIAHAVQNTNADFKPTPHRSIGDSIGHELVDALVYIVALANVYEVDLELEIGVKFSRWYAKELQR